MKGLSIEEKAKRFDEASKWMDGIYPTLTHEQQMEAEAFFPKLKESEDERIRKRIISALEEWEEKCSFPGDSSDMIVWLEKQGEQKPAWSEEDDIMEQHCHQMLALLRPNSSESTKDIIDNCHHWLKLLKDRVGCEVNCATTKEWSVEDGSKIQRICKYLDEAKKYYADITEIRECIEWLKSLKPQSTWKPSDEQMNTLRQVISGCSYDIEPLVEIEEQLKKLKEE